VRPTQERIDRGVRYMKRLLASDDARAFKSLTLSAQLLYIASILICNDAGVLKKEQLNEAAKDEEVRFAALTIAGRVGLLGPAATLDRYV
jgi:hypothetical protein